MNRILARQHCKLIYFTDLTENLWLFTKRYLKKHLNEREKLCKCKNVTLVFIEQFYKVIACSEFLVSFGGFVSFCCFASSPDLAMFSVSIEDTSQ